jgi:hypothetical protein
MASKLAEVGDASQSEASQVSARRELSARNAPVQQDSFHDLVEAIAHSKIAVEDLAVTALHGVLSGVITGEGPAAAGRVHFSRTLDPADAALCARILESAGGATGLPVTRHEADVLLDIDAAAAERTDNGRFGDLLVKSIAHCALAEAGHKVPPRQVALAPETELSSWANHSTNVDAEILAWIASHVNTKRHPKQTLIGLSGFLTGVGAALSFTAPSVVMVVDLVA